MSKIEKSLLLIAILALPVLGYAIGRGMVEPQYNEALLTIEYTKSRYLEVVQDLFNARSQITKDKSTIATLTSDLEVKPKEIIKEVPVIQTVEVTKEVVKEVPQLLKEFGSLDEAQAWVDKNKMPTFIIPSADNVTYNFTGADERYDCDDYARDFQNLAALDGYQISQVFIGADGYLFGTKVTQGGGAHLGNFARIGNYFYYIESSPLSTQGQIIKLDNIEADSVPQPFISMVGFIRR